MTVLGADRIKRKLRKLPAAVEKHVAKANHASGEELIRIAKILIPAPTGVNRAQIEGSDQENGSYLADFGPKAKVIEENRPFVNPALSVTRKKHKARAKRALKAGVKEAFGGA